MTPGGGHKSRPSRLKDVSRTKNCLSPTVLIMYRVFTFLIAPVFDAFIGYLMLLKGGEHWRGSWLTAEPPVYDWMGRSFSAVSFWRVDHAVLQFYDSENKGVWFTAHWVAALELSKQVRLWGGSAMSSCPLQPGPQWDRQQTVWSEPSSSLSLSVLILWMMHGVPDRRSTHWKSTLTFADKLKARTGHYFTPHWALGSQTFSLTIMEIAAAGALSHKSEIWRSTCFNSLLFLFRFDLQGFL